MYSLKFSPRADREIRMLMGRAPKYDVERLLRAIDNLEDEPRPHGTKKMKGIDELYRIRVGNYRIVYKIYDDVKIVAISRVLRRTETTYRA